LVSSNNSFIRRALKQIATLGFIGYLPVAPGTWGTLAGLFFLIFFRMSLLVYLSFITLCIAVGIIASGTTEEMIGERDSGHIIIDEFTGYLISLLALPQTIGYCAAAFFLFRFLDILKPPPIRTMEDLLTGGIGIMADDIMAGVCTNLTLQAWRLLHPVIF
jgi:phosphatidylglycerophosphatase A